jgi:hypothetical protein
MVSKSTNTEKEKTMKKTTKKTTKKSTPKKSAKSTIFSNVKNTLPSMIVSAVRTLSATKKRLVSIVEIAEFLTAEGNPISAKDVRRKLQKIRSHHFKSDEERQEMKGNGQIQLSAEEVMGWRKNGSNPIGYGIEKGKLS